MTLEQLRIFLEVAATEHITRAAQRLNMTQSAVSAAIGTLETRHAVALFDRVGRSIVLNQNGRLFIEEAKKVLAAAKAAELSLADLSGFHGGELSIMASRTVGSYWLPVRLARYRQLYPGIDLTVRIGNTNEVVNAVREGAVEIGLIEWPEEVPGIEISEVAQDEMIVVIAPDHPWANVKSSDLDLASTGWVLRERGSGTRNAFSSLLKASCTDIRRVRIEMELPGNEAVLGLVEQGVGATLISRSAAQPQLDRGTLLMAPIAPLPRPYFLLRHQERYHSRAADAFAELASHEK